MISADQRDKIADLVDGAVKEGATVAFWGDIPEDSGFFYPATVFTDVLADAAILREEIFGPVAVITTFSDLECGIAAANDTDFGLTAYSLSEDAHTADYLTTALNAGIVGINRGAVSDAAAPFGDVKESGFGREGGAEEIMEYVDVRYIAK